MVRGDAPLVPDAETAAGGQYSSPTDEMGQATKGREGGEGVRPDSCNNSHARPPACKAHPESRTRSCTAMLLLIASPPCLPRSLLYRVPRTHADILPRTSARQIAQTRTLRSNRGCRADNYVGGARHRGRSSPSERNRSVLPFKPENEG